MTPKNVCVCVCLYFVRSNNSWTAHCVFHVLWSAVWFVCFYLHDPDEHLRFIHAHARVHMMMMVFCHKLADHGAPPCAYYRAVR